MARRTLEEINEALASVRAAIRAAETAQRYSNGAGQEKEMARLQTLYAREDSLLDERARLNMVGGPARNYGVYRR